MARGDGWGARARAARGGARGAATHGRPTARDAAARGCGAGGGAAERRADPRARPAACGRRGSSPSSSSRTPRNVRHLRDVPAQGRMHDPHAGAPAPRPRAPERRRAERGPRAHDGGDRHPWPRRPCAGRPPRGRRRVPWQAVPVHHRPAAHGAPRRLRAAAGLLPPPPERPGPHVGGLRRHDRHVRAELHGGPRRRRPPPPPLRGRLERPGAVPPDVRSGRGPRPRRPRPPAAALGLRRHLAASATRRSCGARATSAGTARRCCATSSPATSRCR